MRKPAIEALLNDINDLERKAADTKAMVNRLCELADEPPMFMDTSAPDHRRLGSIRSDQFYGRVLTAALREYLEMRHAANLGPASPREIYDALVEGGFQFDTKNVENAITHVRATLRKSSSIFHRLPNGEYGLLEWYPKAKPHQQADEAQKPARKVVRKRLSRQSRVRLNDEKKVPFAKISMDLMAEGGNWNPNRLKQEAIRRGVSGIDETTKKLGFQGALLGLKKQGKVTSSDAGWRIVPPPDEDDPDDDSDSSSATVVELKNRSVA